MIHLPDPAMALNSWEMSKPMSMWNSRTVYSDVSVAKLVSDTAAVAAGAPGGMLAALVINCHGIVNQQGAFLGLALGKNVKYTDLNKFHKWKYLVESIYIQACGAAHGKSGKQFCKKLARVTKSYVYAAEQDQVCWTSTWTQLVQAGPGWMDDFEGQVFEFGPGGDVSLVAF